MLAEKAEIIIAAGRVRILREALAIVRSEFRAYLETLRSETVGAELLVATAGQLAAPSAAKAAGIGFRCVVLCPLLIPSKKHPPVFFPYRKLPRPLNSFLWKLSGVATDSLLKRTLNEQRRAMGLGAVSRLWEHCLGPRPILAADAALAPVDAETALRVTQTGSLLFDDPAALNPELETFLTAGPPPAYIGFGSMTDRGAETTSVMLARAVRAAGFRGLISRGWAGFETPGDTDLLTIGEVSHARLFPRVSVVVHHGGAGTTAAAARAGVPQIIVPHFLDQHYWASRVADLGLGPAPIPRKRLQQRSLAEALRLCASDPGFRARAAAFASHMRTDAVNETVRRLESGT
jgi:vancomycin aglycone glucosyltransferase